MSVAWWWRGLAPIGLPLVLWWIGTFFLKGDLGKWLDDYGFHLRDPATDTYAVPTSGRRCRRPGRAPTWAGACCHTGGLCSASLKARYLMV